MGKTSSSVGLTPGIPGDSVQSYPCSRGRLIRRFSRAKPYASPQPLRTVNMSIKKTTMGISTKVKLSRLITYVQYYSIDGKENVELTL